jgi:hypothetical protein
VAFVIALPANAVGLSPSYVTSTGAVAGVTFTPLINSGDTAFGDIFEGIPDGIGVVPGPGRHPTYVDLYVNHEQSRVPFGGFADFSDSSVSRVRIDLATKSIINLEVALPSSAGFIRFCSSTVVSGMGFRHPTLFTNEESNDPLAVPAGATYGADPFYAPAPNRQAGYTVALDTVTGAITPIAGMGRHNHENQVLIPGNWDDKLAFLSGDDTFTAPGSQLYMYLAEDARDVLKDRGHLWAFQVTRKNGVNVNPSDPYNDANDYLEVAPGDTLAGRFIRVPDDIARGTTTGEPQAALEAWSNANNIFQFVRVEDIAYDPDSPRTVYFADTGSTRLREDPGTGRLIRPATADRPYYDSDGRIFKMVLNRHDPRKVDSLTIVGQGRLALQQPGATPIDPPVVTVLDAGNGMRNPDNVAVSHSSLMVQEDPAGNAKVWLYSLAAGTWTWIATANQPSAETSGIVDMSKWLGAGWWALDVQSHINLPGSVSGVTYTGPGPNNGVVHTQRREDGQLLFMYVPGS